MDLEVVFLSLYGCFITLSLHGIFWLDGIAQIPVAKWRLAPQGSDVSSQLSGVKHAAYNISLTREPVFEVYLQL